MSKGDSHIVDLRQVPAWAKKTTIEAVDGEIPGFRCDGCGHVWKNRTDEPQTCPECGAGIVWDEDELNDPRVLTESDFAQLQQPDSLAGDMIRALNNAELVMFSDDSVNASRTMMAVWHGSRQVQVYSVGSGGVDEATVFNVSDEEGKPLDRSEMKQHIDDWFENEDLSQIETDESESRPASDEDALTLADILGDGDENNGPE